MKSLSLFLLLFIVATTSNAQYKVIKLAVDSGIFAKDRIWYVKTLITPVKLNNGYTLKPDGSLITQQGTATQLKNGDYIDENGVISTLFTNNQPASGWVMNNNKILQLKAPVKMAMDKGYMTKIGGKVWVVEPMVDQFNTINGITVSIDGMIKTKDGKTFTLQNSDCIDENGNQTRVGVNPKIMNCVYMHYGKMMRISPADKPMSLPGDVTVMPDGTIKSPTKTWALPDSGQISLDGSSAVARMPARQNK